MNHTEIVKIGILILTACFGGAVIAYEGYARPRGLSVGSLLRGDFSWLQGASWLALIGAILSAGYFGAWWHALVVFVAANLLTRILFSLFGATSQIVSALGVLICIPASLAVIVWL